MSYDIDPPPPSEPTPEPTPEEPEERLITANEARAKVCHVTINSLRISAQALASDIAEDDDSNAAKNSRSIAAASIELVRSLEKQLRHFEKSPIIAPRGLKVVR